MTTSRRGTIDPIEAGDDVRRCSTLARIDHIDAHLMHVESGALASPEWWAREILEGTTAAMRVRLRAGWTMLGIGLRHSDANTVAGWPIAHSSAEYVRLQGDSRFGLTGQLITRVTADGIVFATVVHLGNPVARALWSAVLPTHLTIVRSLLHDAAERVG